ncbi:MAG: UDP-N-acetylglucosamine 2-epimerase (non-hydrolyzing) [Pyrinomonadaceae bacterium]|nr:UDP-N-acetylglucosamine 2-epimerase (non-hydrolyzing) [Pyrinomonadaceae bacterium]
MLRVLSIVGARPQFIKAAPVSKALRQAGHTEFLVHSGQHYDHAMSQIFFDELGIPEPDINLNVGSGTHGWQTAQMLANLEEVMLSLEPDWVLVYGDTNTTLAGALAAVKLNLPLAHVEAGLRSFNRSMPEEHNRVLVDHCADIHFCPTQTAVENLKNEGVTSGVHLVGDTMYDAVLEFSELARERSTIMKDLGLQARSYILATIHRPYNTDVPEHLDSILSAFNEIHEPIVFPVHPRTRKKIAELNAKLGDLPHLKMIEPLGYLDMLLLEQNARLVLTDSGGIQKEAYFFGVPCVTLRQETEWVETVKAGWNVLVGKDREQIREAANGRRWPSGIPPSEFGDGQAADRIVSELAGSF